MARISATPVASAGDFVNDQYPVLERDFYGVMFRSYTMPVKKLNAAKGVEEELFYARFLVTHTRSGQELQDYSETWCKVRTKMFYDPVSQAQSTYHSMLAALLAGKHSPEEIVELAEADQLPDLDELIGFPCVALIEPAQQPDKNGVRSNFVSTKSQPFSAPNKDLRAAAIAVYKTASFAYDKNGLRFMSDPKPVVVQVGGHAQRPSSNNDELDEEIPF
jgi:hypothetical protein